jgi:hypothetical protein
VLAPDGTLDRAAVRRLVFSDETQRRRLEAILHPRIQALRVAWTKEREAEGAPLVVAEIPLLFETGGEREFDVVVLVDASAALRAKRLVEVRGFSEEEARRIMAAQGDAAAKRGRADIVLDNDGTQANLEARALEVLGGLERQAGQPAMRIDLHLHTWGSWDCLSDPRAVLDRARARGIGRIAITDHNRVAVGLRLAEEFPDEVIPGEEVRTAEGVDVIGLYLREEIAKGTPAEETVARVHEQGGIAYLPHPYAGGKGQGGRYAEELARRVDIVEVFNARLHPGRLNAPALALARRHTRPMSAGSDAHTVGEVGGAFVELARHANRPEALLGALRGGSVHGVTASAFVHLASTWAKVRKRLPGAAAT